MKRCDDREPLTIDVNRYLALPADVRARFDAWMKAEHLTERMVFHLAITLGEGYVTIERYAADADGNLIVDGYKPVRITETVPVATLPPPEAFLSAPLPATTKGEL